jgi:hypothetical protein
VRKIKEGMIPTGQSIMYFMKNFLAQCPERLSKVKNAKKINTFHLLNLVASGAFLDD